MNTTETTILTGSNDDLEAAMEAETALVVDHRTEEDEVLSEIGRFLPDFSYSSRFEDGSCRISMKYKDKEIIKEYLLIPHNCFRIVVDAASLIRPEADIRVYEPTVDSDTHVFFIALLDFWSQFDREASTERRRLFGPVEFLDSAWSLSSPTSSKKNWWKFWK